MEHAGIAHGTTVAEPCFSQIRDRNRNHHTLVTVTKAREYTHYSKEI